ncbi:hypothetical protein Baya_13738 [Bagarius yarrelli]|uniref:Uncharacterized protein n=1 Tax=Bagarius yarrelli TaxID=175774 RepID=A0A556V778_BAGYA|nr:hypothetical protein Baya_13738 [Bagarius yarrelli]
MFCVPHHRVRIHTHIHTQLFGIFLRFPVWGLFFFPHCSVLQQGRQVSTPGPQTAPLWNNVSPHHIPEEEEKDVDYQYKSDYNGDEEEEENVDYQYKSDYNGDEEEEKDVDYQYKSDYNGDEEEEKDVDYQYKSDYNGDEEEEDVD